MKTIFIRFTFLVAVLVLNVVCLFGQNYKTVHFDREGYFESEGFGLYPDGSGLPNLSTSNEDQIMCFQFIGRIQIFCISKDHLGWGIRSNCL
jgi:hypothetical protein